jgi:hypothetical protein
MAAKTITLTLAEPIVGHEGIIKAIVLRPPNLLEYARFGEPSSVVRGADGSGIVVDNDTAIAAYVEVCTVEPKETTLLEQVGLADAMSVKKAILDFFAAARQARLSPTSPTSSS